MCVMAWLVPATVLSGYSSLSSSNSTARSFSLDIRGDRVWLKFDVLGVRAVLKESSRGLRKGNSLLPSPWARYQSWQSLSTLPRDHRRSDAREGLRSYNSTTLDDVSDVVETLFLR